MDGKEGGWEEAGSNGGEGKRGGTDAGVKSMPSKMRSEVTNKLHIPMSISPLFRLAKISATSWDIKLGEVTEEERMGEELAEGGRWRRDWSGGEAATGSPALACYAAASESRRVYSLWRF